MPHGRALVSYLHRDPVIRPTLIADLRPTQMTVGMREVERKRKAWDNKGGAGKVHTLATHMVPIVLGPGGARYVTDHHHLARALLDDGQKEVYVIAVGDLSKADPAYFWNLMDYHGWTHPYDQKGRRCDYEELPKSVKGRRGRLSARLVRAAQRPRQSGRKAGGPEKGTPQVA
jgi:hypothetical protein